MLIAAASLPPMVILACKAVCWSIGLCMLGLGFVGYRRVCRRKADYKIELEKKPSSELPLPNPVSPFPFSTFLPGLAMTIGATFFLLPWSGVFHVDYRNMSRRIKEARKYRAPNYNAPQRALRPGEPRSAGRVTLSQAREDHSTYLQSKTPAPQESDKKLAPPDSAQLITYKSGELDLKAWISPDPGDGKQHPAIVYLHGGFALGDGDWLVLESFRKAGFITMTPSLRGENGNPGNFEFFYGEVSDALAAGSHLALLPYVDEEQVYVCGHSIGGQLCVMVAECDSIYRGAVAFSPTSLDVASWVQDIMRGRATGSLADKELIVFNPKNANEVGLRNPLKFAQTIQIPLVMYYEDRRSRSSDSASFISTARSADQPVLSQRVSFSDHMSMLPKSIESSIPWMKFLALVDPNQITGSNIQKYWGNQSLDSFVVAKTFRTVVETLNLSAYVNDLAPGMTEPEVIQLLGEPGHYGQMETSPALKAAVESATKSVLERRWTKDTGAVMHTDFNAEGKLCAVGMSGRDSEFKQTMKKLSELSGSATEAEVESILEEQTFAMIERRDRHLVWTSDSQMIVVTFDEAGLARSTASDPNVRPTFRRQRKPR